MNPVEELMAMIAKKREQEQLILRAEQAVKAAGFTESDWYRIVMLRETFDDLAGAIAYFVTVASRTGNKAAAATGCQMAACVADEVKWMNAVLCDACVSPDDLGMRADPQLFYSRMQRMQHIFNRVLAGEDLSQFSAEELTAGVE